MPLLSCQTRQDLRVEVGKNLGAVYLGIMSGSGSTSTVIDSTLRGGNDTHNGKHLWFTGPSNNDGTYRRVDDFAAACDKLTTDGATITSTAACDTYEMWLSNFDPRDANRFINQSIRDSFGITWTHVGDRSLHGSDRLLRLDIPTNIAGLTDVEYRRNVRDRQILPVRIWDEAVDADFTVTLDAEDTLFGRRPVKFAVAGTVTCGDTVSDLLCSTDFSGFTHVEFGFKTVETIAACDVLFRLDDACGNVESISIPAVVAAAQRQDVWVRLALATPETDTAVTKVTLEYNANAKANTFWMTDIRATHNDTEEWASLHPREWSVDKANRDILFTPGARNRISYKTIRLTGGDTPTLLCTDATVADLDNYYITARTTELMLSALGSARTERQERDRLYWRGEAQQARKAFVITPNMRQVE